MRNLLRTSSDFSELKGAIFERLQQLIPSSQVLSVQQKKLLEDFMNLADLTERTLQILRFYNEIRHLTDAMIRRYDILPQDELQPINFQEIKSELTTLYHLLQLMVKTPSDEVKMIDEHITYLQALLGKFRGRRESFENELFRLEERKKRKELDKEKFQRESGGFLRFGKKRYAKERLNEVERELRVINEETLALNEKIGDVDKVIDLYLNLQKKLEVTSDYRKKLNSILDRSKEYQRLLSEISAGRAYSPRSWT